MGWCLEPTGMGISQCPTWLRVEYLRHGAVSVTGWGVWEYHETAPTSGDRSFLDGGSLGFRMLFTVCKSYDVCILRIVLLRDKSIL